MTALPAGSLPPPTAADRGPLVLEARSLSRDFVTARGRHGESLSAVHDVSFGLYRSAVVALVGESGSGKSTVARLLAGQDRPTRGTITLDGHAVTPWRRRHFAAYKSEVQMIFQDPFASLNPVHTVGYHLRRPLRVHRSGLSHAEVDQEVTRLLTTVRLTPTERFAAAYPHELSGGQRQRVAIARALAVSPRILLADEPVSMLDVSIRLGVLDLLDDLRERLELAVLYITHDIASARYFADDTLVMYAGEIVECGPSEALTQSPAHPYTQLLVASAPDPDALGRGLATKTSPPASRPSTPATITGCRFSGRCPLADDRCRTQAPPLFTIAPHRAAACWRLDIAAPALVTNPSPTHPA
jgi:peptide/nickel transport system ATP-binding protein